MVDAGDEAGFDAVGAAGLLGETEGVDEGSEDSAVAGFPPLAVHAETITAMTPAVAMVVLSDAIVLVVRMVNR
ncbi:hypothetical protein [Paenarthrobacter sp. NPDC058040]|uniref:hypothetical protein n=1 Tax=unclassified Paenarthrobacter TaxID=2634190 RepID=UPI0036D843E9